jgi:hypothetical protein
VKPAILEFSRLLEAESIKLLQQALNEQKLDPETLRKAIFPADKTAQ